MLVAGGRCCGGGRGWWWWVMVGVVTGAGWVVAAVTVGLVGDVMWW